MSSSVFFRRTSLEDLMHTETPPLPRRWTKSVRSAVVHAQLQSIREDSHRGRQVSTRRVPGDEATVSAQRHAI